MQSALPSENIGWIEAKILSQLFVSKFANDVLLYCKPLTNLNIWCHMFQTDIIFKQNAVGPSVKHILEFSELEISKFGNVNGSTDFSFQTHFLQFVWISSDKIHSKVNSFHTFALKIVK